MRNISIVSAGLSVALLLLSPLASAQRPGLEVPLVTPGPGWKTCPRCENDAHIAEDRKKANVDSHAFEAHDLSGVWGDNGIEINYKGVPSFTPYGQKLYEGLLTPEGKQLYAETKKPVDNPGGVNINDPLTICDPLGYPRSAGYSYGMEFVQVPGRVFQFFDWSHTWRTIWTDGRKLPDDPPVQRYLGYAVGRWDGDTFIVQSSGYDPRSFLGGDAAHLVFPHTADMKVEESYKRLDYGKLQITLTVIDPKVYTKPWITNDVATLRPNAEIDEYFCVPSESINFNERQTDPSNGGPEEKTKK